MGDTPSDRTFVSVEDFVTSCSIRDRGTHAHPRSRNSRASSAFLDRDAFDEEDLLAAISAHEPSQPSQTAPLATDTAAFMWELDGDSAVNSHTELPRDDADDYPYSEPSDICVNLDCPVTSGSPALWTQPAESIQPSAHSATPNEHQSPRENTSSAKHLRSRAGDLRQSIGQNLPSSRRLARVSTQSATRTSLPARTHIPDEMETHKAVDNVSSVQPNSYQRSDVSASISRATVSTDHRVQLSSSTTRMRDELTATSGHDTSSSLTNGRLSDSEEVKLLQSSTRGMTSCEVTNPLYQQGGDNTQKLVLFSTGGELMAEERTVLERMASFASEPESRLISRLVETIGFQRKQMEVMQDTERDSAVDAVDSERRRFSEVERRRSFAMQALVAEIDRLSKLQREQSTMEQQFQQSQRQLDEVVSYFKQFDDAFSFGSGVFPALEAVHEQVHEMRRESAQRVKDQDVELDEYAERLLTLERIVADSKKRQQELLDENAELKMRITLQGEVPSGPLSSLTNTPVSHSVTANPLSEELESLKQQLGDKDYELDMLRELLRKSSDGKKSVDDALLNLNVDLESAIGKSKTLREQRDAAETKCREIHDRWVGDRENYLDMSRELSENIIAAVRDLDDREAQIRSLTSEIADRESAMSAQKQTLAHLEQQLRAVADAALSKDRAAASGSEDSNGSGSTRAVDAIVDSLRNEVSNAETLLEQRSDELATAKGNARHQDEMIISLQRECDRLRTVAAAKAGSANPEHISGSIYDEEHESSFLRRLSACLGCHAESNHELVAKLVKRVEDLMKERTLFEQTTEELRRTRERALHGLRSEMQAEISALKAQVAHLENVKDRAIEEREAAEKKILEMSGDADFTIGESVGDVTASSFVGNRWSIGEDTESLRRSSAFSAFMAEGGLHWSDPIITAAVQSVSALIGTKDSLAARNRALREKLDSMINRMPVNEDSSSISRALMIESRSLQDELTGIVGMQQNIIDRMRSSMSANEAGVGPEAEVGDAAQMSASDARGLLQTATHEGSDDMIVVSTSHSRAVENRERHPVHRASISGAASFLREQLTETRALYSEKLNANAHLCGVVNELEQELEQVSSEKKNIENVLATVSESHEHFVLRLAELVGTGKSTIEIEDRLRMTLIEARRMTSELQIKDVQQEVTIGKLRNMVAQKHLLSHMIDTYQSKYHLDLLARPADEPLSPKQRLRAIALVVIAGIKLTTLPQQHSSNNIDVLDITKHYDVPTLALIGKRRHQGHSLLNASVALSAIPRLETAIATRESEVGQLRAALASLSSSTALDGESVSFVRTEMSSAFAYDEDILERKNDLSRRLGKTIKEKEELELRLSQERQNRIASEAKSARYVEKVSNLKRRLAKSQSNAESRERTYKAAIRYLKSKADKAIDDDFNMDENSVPMANRSTGSKNTRQAGELMKEKNAKSIALLEGQLSRAEADIVNLDASSDAYDEAAKYIQGLRKAVHRLRQAPLATSNGGISKDLNREPVRG